MKNKLLIIGIAIFSFLTVLLVVYEIETRMAVIELNKMGYDTVTNFNLPFYPVLIFEIEPIVLFAIAVFVICDVRFINKLLKSRSEQKNGK